MIIYELHGFVLEVSEAGDFASVSLGNDVLEQFEADPGRCRLEGKPVPQVQAQRFARKHRGQTLEQIKPPKPAPKPAKKQDGKK